MRIQKYNYVLRSICLMLIVSLLSCLLTVGAADNETEAAADTAAPDLSKHGLYAGNADMLGNMQHIATSGELELYANEETAEIAVRDISSGEVWSAVPYDYNKDAKASDETKASLASFISLTYYDSASKEYTMNGYEDCVARGQFECEPIDNGIRINMQVGTLKEQFNVPFAAEAERFEKKVLNKLSGIAKRRVEAFYTKYSADDDELDSKVKERLLELYPGLADYDFYILRDDATERDISVLNGYISETDYTAADFKDDTEKSGSDDLSEAAALFEIPVEFYLDDNSLVVRIDAKEISYDKSAFVLNKIKLMEYFGAGKSLNSGYLFVPDGSGSIINFNTDGTKKVLNTVNQVYGQDYTLLQKNEYQNLSEQAYLPVFGIKENNRAFVGIIEEGDAMSRIISQSGNIISGYETVSAEFTYASVQSYLYEDGKKQNGQWTYISKNYYDGNFTVRYKFMTGAEAGYVGMAKTYRDYLINNGVLKKLAKTDESAFYLETIGLITRKDSFFGIPYNKKISITSFEDAVKLMDDLKENGVANIKLRYKGWANGGLSNTAPSKATPEKKLGGKDGFKTLAEYIKKNNYSLFPDVNFHIVRNNKMFDSFIPLFDSPRSNDDNIVLITPPEELNNISSEQNFYSAIKPSKMGDYYSSYFKSYEKYGIGASSISYAGNMLYSDFDKDNGITRQRSLEMLKENLNKNSTAIGNLMTDGGNAYIFPYAGDILNIPLSDSGNIVEDESVPFMQIVLHGYIRYAGAAVNLSDNLQISLLKSAEYGANLYFALGYENTDSLKDTTLSYMYSIDYNTWKSDIVSLYNKYNSVFASLQNQAIAGHEKLAENVYKTIYEDGTAVAVNYGDKAVNVNGKTVEAMDFAVV